MKLKTQWLEEPIVYDGRQLKSHFLYGKTGYLGNICAGFIGECRVPVENLVDLSDVRRNAPIYSPRMLHFILEDFHLDLAAGILLQRVMVCSLLECLQRRGIRGLRRQGDDLYRGDHKLNVSIATRSPVSTLIHLGVNIETKGTPVPTVGLQEWDVAPAELAKTFLESLQKEYEEIFQAAYKVRPVD